MTKPDSLQGSLDLLVLKILSRRPGLHGYALMTAIQETSREVLRVEEGSLIPPSIAWRKPAGFGRSGSPKTAGGGPARMN